MKTYSDQLDKILTEYLVKKAPALPKSVKDFLVSVAPYFALLGAILGIPALLTVFGLGAIMTPFAFVAGARTGVFWFLTLITASQVILSALAIKPLFARRAHGWRLMYYSQLLSLVNLVRFLNFGSLVITILSFYILYQVKANYGSKK